MRKTALVAVLAASLGIGCKDISSFTTAAGESYCGAVAVDADFVRLGLAAGMKMRLTFDADHLSDAPGALSTQDPAAVDQLFTDVPLRPIPQLFHDALSTLQFGEGRDKNLIYMVEPNVVSQGPSVTAVVSLMHSGEVEVRLMRGAPAIGQGGDAPRPEDGTPLFGVFGPLHREAGQCSF
jgi:hypothetical protein